MFSLSLSRVYSRGMLLALVALLFAAAAQAQQGPTAVADSYTVHKSIGVPPPGLLGNDSASNAAIVSYTHPQHGQLQLPWEGPGGFSYTADNGFNGVDSFEYTICVMTSPTWTCSTAPVTLNVVEHPPVAGDDSYSGHGLINIPAPGVLGNDFDPDGDPLDLYAFHGDTYGLNNSYPATYGWARLNFDGSFSYSPFYGAAGVDTLTYTVCDNQQQCATANITVNVMNEPPLAVPDLYVVGAAGISVPAPGVLANDFDPDGDPITVSSQYNNCVNCSIRTLHGWSSLQSDGTLGYSPDPNFSGLDTSFYKVCDSLGMCSTAMIYYLVDGDAGNAGAVSCNANVGGPVNVTNGNMYLRQTDYTMPGVGASVDITRTYNSILRGTGLFGRGWSSAYDESVAVQDANVLRLNLPDGRAVYFYGSSGALAAVEPDFHGQVSRNGDGTFTLSLKDGSAHQFDAAGRLVSLTDRNGNQTLLAYDASGHLATVTDPFGRALTLTTSATGRVLTAADSMGTIVTYAYGPDDVLQSVTYADNSGFQFGYDGADRLTSVTDALGNTVESHTYDGQGRALTSERQNGVEHYALSYVSASETDVTDALGRVTKYTFDTSKGRNVVTKVEGVCGCGGGGSEVKTWTYDAQLNVKSRTDALGHAVTYTYDGDGNRLTQTDATGTVAYTYNQFGEALTRTDQSNGVTTNTYDAQGDLLTTKDALNNTTTFTYNARGQMLTATDALGRVTTFAYDASGNLSRRTDANGITTFYTYDARRRLTKARDGLSRATQYAYDAAGRLNKVTHPDASFAAATYDLAGRLVTATDERGNATAYGYDGAYRLTSATDALGHATAYGYDAASNLTSVTDALSRVTNYDYDDFNRPVKVTYPPATAGATRLFETFAYDATGNVTRRTDTAGRATAYAYDNVNRRVSTTDANDKTTGFEYDALSRLTAVADALGQRYQFSYDALGRRTGVTRGGLSMSYEYDAVGNRTKRTDYNGTVTTYAYDNLNHLTAVTYPTRTATYSYMVTGQLQSATNENGTVYLGYDSRYRVSSVSDPFNYGVSYSYDTAGNRTKLSLNGATYATYTYDAANRLANLQDAAGQVFAHAYDAANRLTSRAAPNGVTTSYGYDGLNRLVALTHAAGANTLISNQYQYDDAGDITSWANASGSHAYTHDALDRLTSATNSGQPSESYGYDGVGNRTSSQFSASYSYQPFNRLTAADAATYSYDNNGNLLSKADATGTTTYSWNEENQLTQVSLPGGVTVNYKYDALGRRIERQTSAGADERYVYDGPDVLLDLNPDWTVQTTYLNDLGVDNHLRQTSAATGLSYFLADHLGSTSGLTDAAGNLVEQLSYDSFGNGAASARTRYGYTGRERDPDTGLLYYRARWYDPAQGRLISEDPIGLRGGINSYAYVGNSPTGYIDPSGLERLSTYTGTWPPRPGDARPAAPPSGDCECGGKPVEVIIWHPTDNESNGLGGHVSYNIDGYMWSWESGGWANPEPAQQYIARNQQYRSGDGYVLDFGSPDANAAFTYDIKHGYDGHDPLVSFPPGLAKYPYNLVTNNCGSALARAAGQGGYGGDWHVHPLGHEQFIENNLGPYIVDRRSYPQLQYGGGPSDSVRKFFSDLGQQILGVYGAP